ncbi:MAG: amidohydrolase family protein [Gemmatimonadetes bacterium]|uniref:Amidohydrolase family protein n=1 Tax=Candidatus Kutchimonas denitrificans TaxID=3056748 RepID=A0AAE4ZA80_9BACT|nr:amidohydrolase family protein [Gemmatimonadota bacterium]NIR76640.1 amidohydrolase family protein [Candidatus Kutchimonas denitrificans]NIS03409.1 amidohydrolase family protein [Gemmatimonadota bacterium]NIT69270.1 amidohydrolase family protein [Gemmatimonadota bacterium]NIU54742.1 amidohydrolase family protein [Gemmatimonadota bacterium]
MRISGIRHLPLVSTLAGAALIVAALTAARTHGAGQPSAAQTRTAPLAFTGVNVIPMDGKRVLRDQTVVVADGAIQAIGEGSRISVPDEAVRIDAAGKYLIPGLFDMHVHLGQDDAAQHLKLYLANGVTTVQSMHGSPWHLQLREDVASGSVLGPRIFTTGPTTARVGMTTPKEAEEIVLEQKAAGYDAIKQYGSGAGPLDRETYATLIGVAESEGMRVVGHAPRNLPFGVVLEEGQKSIDHMEEIVYTSEAIGQLFEPYLDVQFGRATPEQHPEVLEGPPDPAELEPALDELASRVKAAGLFVTPTLISFGRIQAVTTDEIHKLHRAPQMAYISPLTRIQWSPQFNRYRSGGWSDKLELMSEMLAASHQLQMQLTDAFADAGVPIMAGTDAPLVYVFPGYSLHLELQLLVESGLSPYEALEAATVTPARFLGLEDESGMVAAGKRADLVLLEANPLEDIGATTRIAGVVANGKWLPQVRIDAMLDEIAQGYRPLEKKIAPIAAALQTGDAETALQLYAALDTSDDALASFVERSVNSLGYRLMRSDQLDRALEVFRLNTEYFPQAFNTWDSLAEAYMNKGEDELAIEYYEKSLELNPSNANAKRMIERIRSKS